MQLHSTVQESIIMLPAGSQQKSPGQLAEALLFHSDSDDYLPTAIFRVLIFPSVLTFTK